MDPALHITVDLLKPPCVCRSGIMARESLASFFLWPRKRGASFPPPFSISTSPCSLQYLLALLAWTAGPRHGKDLVYSTALVQWLVQQMTGNYSKHAASIIQLHVVFAVFLFFSGLVSGTSANCRICSASACTQTSPLAEAGNRKSALHVRLREGREKNQPPIDKQVLQAHTVLLHTVQLLGINSDMSRHTLALGTPFLPLS